MSQIKVTCVPILSIKGINPASIVNDIMSGQYSDRPTFLSQTGGVELATLISCEVSNMNQSNKCVHTYLDGTPNMKTVTTGVNVLSGKTPGGVCLYCKRHNDKLPFGYCIRIEQNRLGYIEYFLEPGRMCRPECSLGRINEINLTDALRDKYTKLTQEYLRAVLGVQTCFVAADDFMVLIEHGGTESYEMWTRGCNKYTLLPDVVITPIKREYEVVKLK